MAEPEFPVSVERTVRFESEPDQIWSHIIEGPLISEWMGGPTSIDPRVGGRIEFTPDSNGPLVWGTVEDAVDMKRIQWSWRTDEGLPTLVEIELEDLGDGTTEMTVRETMLPWHIQGPNTTMLPQQPEARFPGSGRLPSLAS